MEENPFQLGSSTFGGSSLCCAGAVAGQHPCTSRAGHAITNGFEAERSREKQSSFPCLSK